MYNEQLEALIDAALADGVLTEKEKQVLFKKAQAMGVDLDEFEMVLDSRLVKLQKEEVQKAQVAAPKSNKFGDVRKCPACGAMVSSLSAVCTECGYEFQNIEATLSAQKLADELKHATGNDKKCEIIQNFPVPISKSDLFAFITAIQGSTIPEDWHDTDSKKLANAYQNKLGDCIKKAKYLFPNDPMMVQVLSDRAEEVKKHNRKENVVIAIACFICLIGVFIIIGGLAAGNEGLAFGLGINVILWTLLGVFALRGIRKLKN